MKPFTFGFFGFIIGALLTAIFLSPLSDNNAYQYCGMREVKSGDCVALVDRKYKKEVSVSTTSDYLITVPTIGEPE